MIQLTQVTKSTIRSHLNSHRIVPFPFFDVQVRYFCSYLSGNFDLPSDMDAYTAAEKERRRKEEGIQEKHYHKGWCTYDVFTLPTITPQGNPSPQDLGCVEYYLGGSLGR